MATSITYTLDINDLNKNIGLSSVIAYENTTNNQAIVSLSPLVGNGGDTLLLTTLNGYYYNFNILKYPSTYIPTQFDLYTVIQSTNDSRFIGGNVILNKIVKDTDTYLNITFIN